MKNQKTVLLWIGTLAVLLIAAIPATVNSLTTYDSVADLAKYGNPGGVFKSAHTRGYYEPGDGGGADYYATNTVTGTNYGSRIKSLIGTTWSWDLEDKSVLDVRQFGCKPDDTTDNATRLQATLNASPSGGRVKIPAGTFKSGPVSVTRNDLQLILNGTVKAAVDGATWLTFTACTNILIEGGGILDGDDKAMGLAAFDGCSNVVVRGITLQNGRVTDVNDPTHTASTGAATAYGIRLLGACRDVRIERNLFYRFGYAGIKNYLSGAGRVARGVLVAPFPAATTEDAACMDITVDDNDFINTSGDKAQIDADAVVIQNMDCQLIPDTRTRITRNRCRNWGWRFVKGQASGIKADFNNIYVGTTIASGVADVDGYYKTMGNAIALFGSNSTMIGNRIMGGSCTQPLWAGSSDVHGRSRNITIMGNQVRLDTSLNASSYMLTLESVEDATVIGNQSLGGYIGIFLRGWVENATLIGNITGQNAFAGLYAIAETQPNTWNGQSPNMVTISGTIVRTSASWGLNLNAGTNITALGTQGVAPVMVRRASGVTGDSVANLGNFATFGRKLVRQSADHAITSSTTLTSSTDLAAAIEANATYNFRAVCFYSQAGTTAGLKIGLTGPSSPTALKVSGNVQISATGAANGVATAYGAIVNIGVASTGQKYFVIEGQIQNGANAGNLTVQFAQSVSDGNATTLLAGSTLSVEEAN